MPSLTSAGLNFGQLPSAFSDGNKYMSRCKMTQEAFVIITKESIESITGYFWKATKKLIIM